MPLSVSTTHTPLLHNFMLPLYMILLSTVAPASASWMFKVNKSMAKSTATQRWKNTLSTTIPRIRVDGRIPDEAPLRRLEQLELELELGTKRAEELPQEAAAAMATATPAATAATAAKPELRTGQRQRLGQRRQLHTGEGEGAGRGLADPPPLPNGGEQDGVGSTQRPAHHKLDQHYSLRLHTCACDHARTRARVRQSAGDMVGEKESCASASSEHKLTAMGT